MKRVPANRYLLFCLVAAAGLFWDLYSKSLVFDRLGYPEGSSKVYLDGWLTFRLFTDFNRGALWGVGQDYTWLFAGLSVVAIACVIFWLFVRSAAQSLWLTISLALIMAGTLGNLYDRIGWHECLDVHGEPIFAVRDFLLFTFGSFRWPVFNFADVFLVSGAIMLGMHSLRVEPATESRTAEKNADNATPTETSST